VDGGMVVNNWLTQALADTLGVPVDRPVVTETTALGAAYLAGLQFGLFGSLEEISSHWQCDRHFRPALDEPTRHARYAGWRKAVARVCQSASSRFVTCLCLALPPGLSSDLSPAAPLAPARG